MELNQGAVGYTMPSLVRFLVVVGVIVAIGYTGLYVLAYHFEPESREVTQPIGNVKVRNQ